MKRFFLIFTVLIFSLTVQNFSLAESITEENIPSEIYPDVDPPVSGTHVIFWDVALYDDNYYAIKYLKENGIVNGYDDGYFRPENSLNRAELFKILVEAKGIDPDPEIYRNCFPDVQNQWFAKYICYGSAQRWVDGYPDGTFKPGDDVNKVEALKMMIEVFEVSLPSGSGPLELPEDIPSDAWYVYYVSVAFANGIVEENINELYYPDRPITRGQVSENLYRILVPEARELPNPNKK